VGQFRRVIRLPFEPDPDKIEAEVRNGVLTLKIAQPAEMDRTKRIAVKSGAADSVPADKSKEGADAAP
jgi:HSP20 family protein